MPTFTFRNNTLGPVYKRLPQSGRLSNEDILWTREFLHMHTSAFLFLVQKHSTFFFKFMVCIHGQGEMGMYQYNKNVPKGKDSKRKIGGGDYSHCATITAVIHIVLVL